MTLTAKCGLSIPLIAISALFLSVTGSAVSAQQGSVPDAPTGVTVNSVSHNSVELDWDDSSDKSITHYEVLRRNLDVHQSGEFITIDSDTGSNATNYTDSTVLPETSYVYRVKAVNRHGASGQSKFARADTLAAPAQEPDPTATPTPTPEPTPLTAEFRDAPDKHEGTGTFTFRIAFSEPISIRYVTLRDDSLEVTNGSATKARRVNGQSDLWRITVEPDSDAAVTVVLPITEDCGSEGTVCTSDGTRLSNRSELTVPGPAAANSPATGAPTISGTVRVGETLTADVSAIDDPDGLGSPGYGYQMDALR